MKITDVQTFIVGNPWKNWVFIKLHTDYGVYGVGEATSHRKAKTAETAVIEMRRYYLGRDPFNTEEIYEGERPFLCKSSGGHGVLGHHR